MNYEDEIYHSGYLDGYYASMELYHSDDSEMTEEEKAKARRKKRRRNIALGVAGAAALGVGGYALKEASYLDGYYAGLERARKHPNTKYWTSPRDSKIKPKRTISGFRRNPGTYRFDPNKDFGGFLTLQEMHRKARSRNYKN